MCRILLACICYHFSHASSDDTGSISVGNAPDLQQALNRACGNNHKDPTPNNADDCPNDNQGIQPNSEVCKITTLPCTAHT